MVAVSIVMPAHNARATIDRAIDSALGQTRGDFELIVVDDVSSDDTVDLVGKRAAADPRIRLLRMTKNGGPAVARNAALDVARGEWIALLDADDAWRPDRLETLLRIDDHEFVADQLVGYDAVAGVETGRFMRRTQTGEVDVVRISRTGYGYDFGFLKPMMRRSFLERTGLRYSPTLRHGEDFVLYVRALASGARFRVLSYAGYVYTTPRGRISATASPHTQTRPDNDILAAALEAVGEEFAASLTAAERAAIAWRADFYRTRIPFDGFVQACRRRDPAAAFSGFVTAPLSVSRHLWRELWVRYIGELP